MLMFAFDDRRRLPAANWIRTHTPELSLFLPEPALRECSEAMQKNSTPPDQALEAVLGVPLGSHIFQCFRDKKLLSDFVKSVRKRLDDLDNLDYQAAELAAAQDVIEREARPLATIGFGPYTVVKQQVPFLNVDLPLEMKGALGIWAKHLAAKTKAIAMQAKQVRLLPWEELLFGGVEVPGARQSLLLDPEMIDNFGNVRDAAMAMLGDSPSSIVDMQRTMNSNRKELLECDEHFDLELAYLNTYAETKLSDKLRDDILAALPSEGNHSISDVISSLETMERGPLCMAVSAASRGQIGGILNMLRTHAEGKAVDPKFLASAGPFFSQCHDRMLWFATTWYP